MFNRVWALCAFGLALSAASLEAQDLFVLPGAGATSGEAQAFVTNPLTTFRTFNAGAGAFALLPNLNASKYFVVASSITNTILATDGTFLAPTLVANLATPPTQAIITQDGKVLVVAAGNVHLFNTESNAELVYGGISQGVGINTFAVAGSLDSSVIFALGSSNDGASQLSAISATTFGITASLQLSQVATAVSVGPNGLIYVSLPNQILEVDPRTLEPTLGGTIAVGGTPGPLVFTTDGLYAVGANSSGLGNSLLIATLATHSATSPSLGIQELTDLKLSGVDTVLALSGQNVYEIFVSPVSVNRITSLSGLHGLATTNDVPTSSHSTVSAVFLVSASTLSQYTPATQAITSAMLAPNIAPGAVTYAVPVVTTAQSLPATLLVYGTNQTILPGTTSEPLVVRVLDNNNVPLSGCEVQFQSNVSGATLSAMSVTTGADGYALTYLTASATAGPVTVTATAGSLTATLPVEVSTTAQTGGGPTLSIVGGQGQLMLASTSTADGPAYGSSLQVLASDSNGNPIAGLSVTFSVPPSGGTLQLGGRGADSQVATTNSAGIASVDFLTTSPQSNDTQGFLQSLVTASAANSNAVTFYITSIPFSPTPTINLLAPQSGVSLTAAEGSTLPGTLKARVYSSSGTGIPNVALSLTDDGNPTLVPTVACNAPGGLVLTNSTGTASCDLTFGPRIGSGTFIAKIGNTHTSLPFQFTVTAGPAASAQIVQGNNQTASAGQRFYLALLIHVADSGGNTVAGVPVTWQVINPGAVTLSNVIGTTDSNGNASALAIAGGIGGVAQVQATAGAASATFNLTVTIPSAGLQKVSGDQQTTVINTAFTSALTVEVVDSSGNGLPGAQVNFQVTSGTATVGSLSAITDSSGQASTTVTAGAAPGTITVSATSAAFSVTFTLTARPPGPSNVTIENGASFNPNTGISPGGIAIIRGVGIVPDVQGVLSAPANAAGQLPTTFSGVTITFNGTPAPIYYVNHTDSSDQVAVQVPFEVQPGSAVSLTVNVASEPPNTVMVPVKPLAPGIFTSVYGGKTYAAAVRPDGSSVSPTNPAQRGENIQLYVTGLGQATPTIATGTPGLPNQVADSPLVVGLNNGQVPLVAAVYGPNLIGVYVVVLQVPADTKTGEYQPIGLIAYDSANNSYYAQSTYIPIQ
jgi:uncharacterized protein (TIGR03437 family)